MSYSHAVSATSLIAVWTFVDCNVIAKIAAYSLQLRSSTAGWLVPGLDLPAVWAGTVGLAACTRWLWVDGIFGVGCGGVVGWGGDFLERDVEGIWYGATTFTPLGFGALPWSGHWGQKGQTLGQGPNWVCGVGSAALTGDDLVTAAIHVLVPGWASR